MKRILLARFSSLGDIVLTTPVIDALKKKHPQAQIDYALKEGFAPLLENHPGLNKIFKLQKKQPLREFAAMIKEHSDGQRYDLFVDLHHNLRSRLLKFFLKPDSTVCYRKPYFKRWMLVLFKKNLFGRDFKTVAEKYLDTVKQFIDRDYSPEMYIHRVEPPAEIRKQIPADYIVFAPGARHFTKKWPTDYFIEAGRILSKERPEYSLVIAGGPDETADAAVIASELKGAINLTGRLSLAESAAVISGAGAVLSNDSGITHIAAAVSTPVLTLFLSTVPEFGFLPPVKEFYYLSEDLACKPCTHTGRSECPREHFNCAYKLKPARVAGYFKDICLAGESVN